MCTSTKKNKEDNAIQMKDFIHIPSTFVNVFRRKSSNVQQKIVLDTQDDLTLKGYARTCSDFDIRNEINNTLSDSEKELPKSSINIIRRLTENNIVELRSLFRNPMPLLMKRLGGEEIGGIKKKLFMFLLDWILDISTAANHYANQAWIKATLTYIIVLGSGIVTTVGFLRYSDIRSKLTQGAKEIGPLWRIFLYIPTFLPFVSGRLWLKATTDHEMALAPSDDNLIAQLAVRKKEAKDLSLKAFWTETVLESKPQALLQTLFLLETDEGFNNILDFLPVLLSLWSMNAITNNIYDLVAENYTDSTTLYSKIYGITYTAVSILAPVMLTNIVREQYDSNTEKFISTLVFLMVYYLIFEIIYELSYLLSNKLFWLKKPSEPVMEDSKQSNVTENNSRYRHALFTKIYQLVLLIFYSSCVISWNFLSQQCEIDNSVQRMILLPIFFLLLLANSICFIKALDFVVEIFRLKNVKIDGAWEKIQNAIKR